MRVYRIGFGTGLRRTRRERILGWLVWPAAILAIPIFLVVALLAVTVLLVLSVPIGFKLWRAFNRLKKATRNEARVIEGEYWLIDEEDRP